MNIDNIPLGCNVFWRVLELAQLEPPSHFDKLPMPDRSFVRQVAAKEMRGHVIAIDKRIGCVVVTYPLKGTMIREDLNPAKITRIES